MTTTARNYWCALQLRPIEPNPFRRCISDALVGGPQALGAGIAETVLVAGGAPAVFAVLGFGRTLTVQEVASPDLIFQARDVEFYK